jgi:hypothetical protein
MIIETTQSNQGVWSPTYQGEPVDYNQNGSRPLSSERMAERPSGKGPLASDQWRSERSSRDFNPCPVFRNRTGQIKSSSQTDKADENDACTGADLAEDAEARISAKETLRRDCPLPKRRKTETKSEWPNGTRSTLMKI